MKWIWLAIVAFSLLMLGVAMAQVPGAQPTLSADAQSLVTQLHAVGCSAEENAAAQTIDMLRKENQSLKAQLQKADPPPKSGATKK
jgi:hypothetical protein